MENGKNTTGMNNICNCVTKLIFKNTPPIKRIHIFFKCKWDINEEKPYAVSETNLNTFERIEIMQNIFLLLSKRILLKQT